MSTKEYFSDYYQKNKDKIKARVKKWKQENRERSNETVYLWRKNNKDRVNANRRDHYQRRGREWYKAYYEANKEKRAARELVGSAVRSGRLIKPTHCPKCGTEGILDAHHADYYKPLDVQWLCRSCHNAHHKAAQSLPVHRTRGESQIF